MELKKASLYFAEKNSNKEYHAELAASGGGFVVNFRYGRRGGALQSGSKTPSPVDYAKAEKIYNKLVAEKTGKGYTPDESGTSYQGSENAGRRTGFAPQLCNAISEAEAIRRPPRRQRGCVRCSGNEPEGVDSPPPLPRCGRTRAGSRS